MVLPLPASKPLKWMFEGATYGGCILDSLVRCSPKSWQGGCWKGVLLVRPFAPGSGGTWRHRAPQGDNPKWFVTVTVEPTHQGYEHQEGVQSQRKTLWRSASIIWRSCSRCLRFRLWCSLSPKLLLAFLALPGWIISPYAASAQNHLSFLHGFL